MSSLLIRETTIAHYVRMFMFQPLYCEARRRHYVRRKGPEWESWGRKRSGEGRVFGKVRPRRSSMAHAGGCAASHRPSDAALRRWPSKTQPPGKAPTAVALHCPAWCAFGPWELQWPGTACTALATHPRLLMRPCAASAFAILHSPQHPHHHSSYSLANLPSLSSLDPSDCCPVPTFAGQGEGQSPQTNHHF